VNSTTSPWQLRPGNHEQMQSECGRLLRQVLDEQRRFHRVRRAA
jgi:hypothetical protein